MGSVDRRHLCATCMRDARSCQGHAGHIELSYPAYHFGFVETVLKTLRTTCFFCARVCAQIVCDDVVYMIYKKEGSDEWEPIELADAEPKPEGS